MVIPAYNEEKRLPSTINETLRYLDERSFDDANFTYEVTIIDDGSEDLTYNVTLDHASRLKVIKQTPNLGKGAAIRKGVLCSRGQLVITADADSAIFIRDMGKLEEKALNLTASGDPIAVFGSRCKVKVDEPLYFGSLQDLTRRDFDLFSDLFFEASCRRWAFDVELIYLARRLGIPVYEVAVNAVDVTGSKLRPSSVCHALYEITMVAIAYGLGFWEIR
ncbi:dolichyl-phosphate beta-glucosyltransferase ALG5D-like [Selaginella moellendorffii]|uniref:dolichyl-phosphate beta-glucosyltransferase ALG5D-like n=1 Tax=Selaginella moellendorffii TaxID=88036 RepID=UPI000D1CA312|nr:dolichyl-phosphate beta-glucosyltransferase ALG5D-like [Selaginella moellendorffii]|eukprot:XP_024524257.1 dolichyl-phosphate beta-glucosyltransferase ALG5D-like [Selaginella moellendorffii]